MDTLTHSLINIGDIKAEILYTGIMQDIDSISCELHSHPYIECHIINSGICEIVTKDTNFTLEEGNFYIIPSMTPHRVSSKSSDIQKMCISFDLQWEKDASPKLFKNLVPMLVSQEIVVIKNKHLHSLLFENSSIKSETKKYQIEAIATLMIINLAERYKEEKISIPLSFKTKPAGFDFIIKVEEYIYKNYMNDISIKSLSEHLHISEKQINRNLKNQFNITYKDLLTHKRMYTAKELLENESISISEIPQKIGFSSYSGFYYSIKKFFGTTPENIKNNSSNI